MNNNWLLAFLLFAFVACNMDGSDFEVGDDLIDTQSRVFMTDTFSVKLSTVQIDSLQASSLDKIVIGTYQHPMSGKLDIQHYFKVDYKDISEDDVFDSLAVRINYSDYYLGDTLGVVEFSIYQLSTELDIFDDPNTSSDFNFNTTSSYPYDEANIVGKFSFRPEPKNDSIEFNLNADFGKEVFDWLQVDPNDENSSLNFHRFIKGFAIKQTGGAPIVLGFLNNTDSKNIQLRMYTHEEKSIEEKPKEYIFAKDVENSNYSKVNYDRTGTIFEELVDQENEMPSTETDGVAIIQGSSGLMVKIDFPSINEINGIPNAFLVRSELVLVPDYSANDVDFLPQKLYFYYTNKHNDFLPNSAITTSNAEYLVASLHANPAIGEYYYSVDITEYMAAQMSDNNYDADNGIAVALQPANMFSTADVLFLTNTKKSGSVKTKLNLYFLQHE